jgi:hypothetical protein
VAVERRERLRWSGRVPEADVAIGRITITPVAGTPARAGLTFGLWETCTSPDQRRSSHGGSPRLGSVLAPTYHDRRQSSAGVDSPIAPPFPRG